MQTPLQEFGEELVIVGWLPDDTAHPVLGCVEEPPLEDSILVYVN